MEGRFNGGYFALLVWGAYIWRRLYMEGLIFGILRYESCTFQPLMSFWPKSCEHRYDSLSPSPPELKIVTSCCFFFFTVLAVCSTSLQLFVLSCYPQSCVKPQVTQAHCLCHVRNMSKYRECMGRSLGLEISKKMEIKIDETYYVASCCCP